MARKLIALTIALLALTSGVRLANAHSLQMHMYIGSKT